MNLVYTKAIRNHETKFGESYIKKLPTNLLAASSFILRIDLILHGELPTLRKVFPNLHSFDQTHGIID